MGVEQLRFFDKDMQLAVIEELQHYKALKVQMENREELKTAGIDHLYPILHSQHHINEMKVRQMKRALDHGLDFMERSIIEKKYFTSEETKDVNIYMELGIKKAKYYDKKNQPFTK